MRNCHSTSVNVHISFLLIFTAGLLLLPLPLIISWIFASLIHEYFHCVSLMICKIPINEITIIYSGANIRTPPMGRKKELICTLSGPVGGLIPVVFFDRFPITAIFSCILTCSNLVPLHGRDGGRVLRCLTTKTFGNEIGSKICIFTDRFVRLLFVFIIAGVCIYLNLVYLLVLFVFILVVKEKFLAKNRDK